jgi:hypothetical protein
MSLDPARPPREGIDHDLCCEGREPSARLAFGGERIFRVAFWFDSPGGPKQTEIAASELTVVRGAA